MNDSKVVFVGPPYSIKDYLAGSAGRVLFKLAASVGWDLDTMPWLSCDDWTSLKGGSLPNLAIALGDQALEVLCGVKGHTKYRGSVLASSAVPGLKVLSFLSPDYIMAGNFGHYYIAQHDMERAKNESLYPEIRRKNWAPILKPTLATVTSYLQTIRRETCWSLDIETRADTLACIGVASGSSALVVPFQTTTGPFWTPAEEVIIWRALQDTFNRCPRLIGQNLAFDLHWMVDYGAWPSGIWLDTMLGFALLYPEYPKGLDMIVSLFTDAPYYKDDGKTWGWKQPDQKLWYYNAQDCIYTLWAAEQIEHELKIKGKWDGYQAYQNRQIYAALEMQRTRLLQDPVNHAKLKSTCEEQALATHSFLELVTGQSLNVNSPKQVQNYLYGKKGLAPVSFKGKLSVDENALKSLRPKYPECQELELIIRERHLRKKLSGYLNAELDPDGHVACSWNIAGTETGRWSSSKSPHWRGINLQTVSKILRYSYRAPLGRVFIQPDLSQAEARVVADLANCHGLRELFNDPTRSVHMENALKIFGVVPKKDSLQYVLAKQCLHAANYKMGPDRFSVEASITKDRAKEILKAYYAAYPEIGIWHNRTRETIIQLGKLITPFGRDRIFYHARAELELTGQISGESWRNAIAYIPQATVPDVLNYGMLRTWDELGPELWLHHQGHDSCMVSIPTERLGETCEAFKRNLTMAIPVGQNLLTIPVEVSWGFFWHPMRGWKGERDASTEQERYLKWANEEVEANMVSELIGMAA